MRSLFWDHSRSEKMQRSGKVSSGVGQDVIITPSGLDVYTLTDPSSGRDLILAKGSNIKTLILCGNFNIARHVINQSGKPVNLELRPTNFGSQVGNLIEWNNITNLGCIVGDTISEGTTSFESVDPDVSPALRAAIARLQRKY